GSAGSASCDPADPHPRVPSPSSTVASTPQGVRAVLRRRRSTTTCDGPRASDEARILPGRQRMDLRVAVVGSGPAGIYAAAALTRHDEAGVDVIDRLPTPFGLIRYGVAPDHEKMKSVAVPWRAVLEQQRVRFLGNVELGR